MAITVDQILVELAKVEGPLRLKEPNLAAQLERVAADIKEFAQQQQDTITGLQNNINDAQTKISDLEAANSDLQQQNLRLTEEIDRLRKTGAGVSSTAPGDLARSLRDVFDTIQSEARSATGVGVTVKSMDVEMKSLVEVSSAGVTGLVFPAAGAAVDPNTLSTLRMSFGAIPVATPTPTPASAAAPAVTGLEPASGPAGGGSRVRITGSGFTGATAVLFGPARASEFTVEADTALVALNPAGSGSVDVTVSTPAGTSPAVADDRFSYQSTPD
jgi:TolA-binding protein